MRSSLTLVGVALVAALVGCKQDPPADVPAEAAAAVAAEIAATEKADALASLSAEDRAAVLAQKICPVTGEGLGTMGTPLKVTIEGRDVFLCCQGCVDALKADPAKYLAMLDAAAHPAADAASPEDAAADDAAAEERAADAPAGG